MKDPKRCAEKFKELEERMDEKNIWVILENLPCELPEQIREHVVELIGRLPRTWRMVVISREEMEESFWNFCGAAEWSCCRRNPFCLP